MITTEEINEREVDLKEIVLRILYDWRFIIIVSLIFAILLGGYRFYNGVRLQNDSAYKVNQDVAYEDAIKTYNKNKTIIEKEIGNLNDSVKRQSDYNNNAILMKLNPYDIQVASISYYMDTNYKIMPELYYQNVDIANGLLRSYTSYIKDGSLYDYINKQLSYDIDIKYLKEVIETSVEYDNRMITIQVCHYDKEKCEEIVNLVRNYFEEVHVSLNEMIGKHDLEIVNDSILSVVDISKETTQKEKIQLVVDYNNSLDVKKAELSALSVPVKATETSLITIKKSIKFSIVGFVLGTFLACLILLFSFLLSDKFFSTKQVRQRYNIRILGYIKKNKKSLFGFNDNFINRLEGYKTYQVNEEEEFKRIASNIKANFNSADVHTFDIMFTGTINYEKIDNICKKVSALLDNKKFNLISSSNISYSANTIDKLVKCNAAVIIEEMKQSTYSEVTDQLIQIKEIGKDVIGVILLD